jgi:hypothetical protein
MSLMVDSVSSCCFIDASRAAELQGKAQMTAPVQVKVAREA